MKHFAAILVLGIVISGCAASTKQGTTAPIPDRIEPKEAFVVQAGSASEVFEAVAASVVAVRTYDAKGEVQGLGSGVVLPDGGVATNCHVIEDAGAIEVVHQAKEHPATLRYSDWDRDVCSLTARGLKAPAVVLGSTEEIKVGSRVYAIGAPGGLEQTLSDGIVSSLRPVVGGQYLQITAPISPGSSGGGLFDETGRLIGLTTFYLTEGQQLNFAVPVEWLAKLPQRHAEAAQAAPIFADWLKRAMGLESIQDWEGLLDHALLWTSAEPEEAFAWYVLGLAYNKLGQTAKAIEAYQQALKIDPEDAKAWYNLGVIYSKLGQTAKAIKAYQQALRIDPEAAWAWGNLGVAYWQLGQAGKAIEAYQQALKIDSGDARAWLGLGAIYGDSGQTAKAIEAYQQALEIDPEDAWVWYVLGLAYGKSGQTAKAIEAFQKALRIDPEDGRAWVGLGLAYSISGQRGKVIEVYRRLKSIDPDLADEFFNDFVLP